MRNKIAKVASLISVICLFLVTACQPPVSPQAPAVGSIKNLTAKPTMTTVNLTWDAFEGADTYKVSYKTNYSDKYEPAITVTSPQYLATKLWDNQKYDFCVEAYAGTKLLASSTITSQTPSVSAPENLTAKQDDIDAYVYVSCDLISNYSRQYVFYRAMSENGPWTEIHRGTYPSYDDESVERNIPYYYTVTAFYADGSETEKSAPVRVVIGSDNTPKNLKVESTLSSITLSWDPVDGAVSYYIEMDDTKYFYDSIKKETLPSGTTSWTVKDLLPDTIRYFRVRAQTSYEGSFATISGKTEDLAVVSLTHANPGSKSVSLTWGTSPSTALSDNVVFDVYRYTDSDWKGTELASNLTGMAFTDSDPELELSRYYYYTVVPRIKDKSTEYTEQVLKCGTPAYAKPDSFAVSGVKRTKCSLSWGAVADAGVISAYTATKYIVSYRKKGVDSNYTEKPVGDVNYELSGLSPDTEYEAFVFMRNNSIGENAIAGEPSAIINFKTQPAFGIVSASSIALSEVTNAEPSKTTIRVSWAGVQDAAKYEISCRIFAGRSMKLVTTTPDATVTTADIQLNGGNRYQFQIKAFDSIDDSVTSLSEIMSYQSVKIVSESAMASSSLNTQYYLDTNNNLTTEIWDLMNTKTWKDSFIPVSTMSKFNIGVMPFAQGSGNCCVKASMTAEMLASLPYFIFIEHRSYFSMVMKTGGVKERFGATGWMDWVNPTTPTVTNSLNSPVVSDVTAPLLAGLLIPEEAIFNNTLYLKYTQLSSTGNNAFGVSFLY